MLRSCCAVFRTQLGCAFVEFYSRSRYHYELGIRRKLRERRFQRREEQLTRLRIGITNCQTKTGKPVSSIESTEARLRTTSELVVEEREARLQHMRALESAKEAKIPKLTIKIPQ